jgi:hypothetical protein
MGRRLIRFDSSDRDQWQTNVAHLLKQAMQRGLVEDRPDDQVPSLSVRLSPSNQAAHRPAPLHGFLYRPAS